MLVSRNKRKDRIFIFQEYPNTATMTSVETLYTHPYLVSERLWCVWVSIWAWIINNRLSCWRLILSARYTVLTSPKKDETAVCSCSCWLNSSSYWYWFTSRLKKSSNHMEITSSFPPVFSCICFPTWGNNRRVLPSPTNNK